ncbi:tetratricopeptide repeat protein [Roseospira navarrensis]|uniref:Tetratricopeptide repeat protein n=1 Tax=Roseospira navarrensis TaxID=140058 RepID=A0A7X1ZGP3_9PROT|nr:tetratricopeptide repeat protein [Roseospira navarrensis]MQX37276.1 hypothetical protein [Roseospira navarrensis]
MVENRDTASPADFDAGPPPLLEPNVTLQTRPEGETFASDLWDQLRDAFAARDIKHCSLLAFAVTKAEPAALPGWIVMAECQRLQGQTGRALDTLGRALRLFLQHPELLRLKGEVLLAEGRADEAAAAFRACLRADPLNVIALYGLRGLMAEAGRDTAPIDDLLDPAEDPQTVIEAWRTTAPTRWSWSVERNAMAPEAVCRQAVAQAPGFAPAYQALGAAVGAGGNIKTAARLFRRAAQLDRDDIRAMQHAALYLADQGRLAEAMRIGRRAISLRPDDAAGYFVMAYLQFYALRVDDSGRLHARGIRLDPEHPAASTGVEEWKDQGDRAGFQWFFS